MCRLFLAHFMQIIIFYLLEYLSYIVLTNKDDFELSVT